MNTPEVLKKVLGGTYGGPSISYQDEEFVLYAWYDAPVGEHVLVRHKDWDTFMELVAEYNKENPDGYSPDPDYSD